MNVPARPTDHLVARFPLGGAWAVSIAGMIVATPETKEAADKKMLEARDALARHMPAPALAPVMSQARLHALKFLANAMCDTHLEAISHNLVHGGLVLTIGVRQADTRLEAALMASGNSAPMISGFGHEIPSDHRSPDEDYDPVVDAIRKAAFDALAKNL